MIQQIAQSFDQNCIILKHETGILGLEFFLKRFYLIRPASEPVPDHHMMYGRLHDTNNIITGLRSLSTLHYTNCDC